MQNGLPAAFLPPLKRKKRTAAASLALMVLGVFVLLIGAFGYMMGDLQIAFLQPLAKEVYAARAVAQNAGQAVKGTARLLGEGFHLLFWDGGVPMRFLSNIMNIAVLLLLTGIMLIFNAVMLRLQSWERMKDLLFVEPAVFFFLLFVYYPVIDLARISFTDMRMLSDATFTYEGLKNYNWLFQGTGWNYFLESLSITATYTFWELSITLVGASCWRCCSTA